jgi:hypothetical protein
LLALVNNNTPAPSGPASEAQTGDFSRSDATLVWDDADHWGDPIPKKPPNTLRIGFQNIGGFSFSSNSLKDDTLCHGITLWEFDVPSIFSNKTLVGIHPYFLSP